MAKRRMLSRRISQSKKVNRLSLKAQIVWTWTIPFLDDFGCYTADPEDIKTEVLPKNKRISEKNLVVILGELQSAGLIHLYRVNGQSYQQYIGFDTFQSFRSDRERQSEYPAYKQGLNDTGIPKTTNDSPKLSKEKLSKDNKYSDSFKKFWEAFIGRWNTEKGRHDKGGKMEAFEEWGELTEQQQAKAMKAAPLTGSKITKDACRWLKYHRWEDFEETPKEDTAAKQKALERKRQEIRKDEGNYYREKSIKELQAMLTGTKYLSRTWLIKEILSERK